MATRFQPHGQFTAHVDGRIIVSVVTGPWNKELVENWAAELHIYAKQLVATGPHVGIAILRESMLCPPDAFAALHDAISYAGAKLQCIGNAIVADAGVEGRSLLLPSYEKLYDDVIPHAIFLDVDSAKAWAGALLARRGY